MSNELSGILSLGGASPLSSSQSQLAVGGEAEIAANKRLAESALRAMGKRPESQAVKVAPRKRVDPIIEALDVPGLTDLISSGDDDAGVDEPAGPREEWQRQRWR